MSTFWYFLSGIAESGLSVFGLRGAYEQPSYQVESRLAPDIEIRRYEAHMAVETSMMPGNEGAAFGRLFRYIAGANAPRKLVSMTAPVAEQPGSMAQDAQQAAGGGMTMRFFLPKAAVAEGVPVPTDPDVHVVSVPAATLCVIRFSGVASARPRETETALLRETLAHNGKVASGAPIYLSYDPPFALPFLRRNEVALPCA